MKRYHAEENTSVATGTYISGSELQVWARPVAVDQFPSGPSDAVTVKITTHLTGAVGGTVRLRSGSTIKDLNTGGVASDANGTLLGSASLVAAAGPQSVSFLVTRATLPTTLKSLEITIQAPIGLSNGYRGIAIEIYDAADTSRNAPEPPTQGHLLVFDMKYPSRAPSGETPDQITADQIGQWFVWEQFGSCPAAVFMHKGVLHWLGRSGIVRYEVPGQWFDDDLQPFYFKYKFAQINAANLNAAFRLIRLLLDGVYKGAGTIRVTLTIYEEDRATSYTWTDDVALSAGSKGEFDITPDPQRATAFDVTIEEVAAGQLTEVWRLRSIAAEIETAGKLRKLGSAQRIGD